MRTKEGNSEVNAHRTTRGMRWQVATLLAAVVALARNRRCRCRAAEPQGRDHDHCADRKLRPGETFAVNNAARAWSKQTGNTAKVIVASDLGQQLAQGFASGNPADIFYLGNDQVATYAKAGDLARSTI